MAQAQQIRSNFLQNHESTWIVNQKFFEIKYINERKRAAEIELENKLDCALLSLLVKWKLISIICYL